MTSTFSTKIVKEMFPYLYNFMHKSVYAQFLQVFLMKLQLWPIHQ